MLTLHQQEALDDGIKLLLRYKRLLIKGSAGVGKTYGANYLEQMITTRLGPQSTYISAPTHKALSILRQKIDTTNRDHINFITAHSAMKLKRHIDYRTGNISFKPNFNPNYPPLQGIKCMFIDEGSMLNTVLIQYIEKYALENDCYVVFLGDEKQINPIGELNSPVFYQGYPEIEFKEIIRQGAGSPIIDLSRNLDWIKLKQDKFITEGNKYLGYTHTKDRERIIKSLAEVNGTDDLKYLAWTNKEVDNINFFVRKTIYTKPNKLEIGESVIFNSPYAQYYYTNEEMKIEEYDCVKYKCNYLVSDSGKGEYETIELKVYAINPEQGARINQKAPPGVLVIHEDSEVQYMKLVKRLKSLCRDHEISWPDYYGFIEQFADLKYNHALTVHKSQGSTFTKTIVNVNNIKLNKKQVERERLIYTAITRAADVLVLYNS